MKAMGEKFARGAARVLVVFWMLLLGQAALAQTTPNFSVQFSPNTVSFGGVSSLIFTIDNQVGGATTITDLGFSANLPTGMSVDNASATTDCTDASLSASTGATALTLSDGRIAPNGVCTVSVPVSTSADGSFTVTSSSLSTSEGVVPSVNATLTVNAATSAPVMTLAVSPNSVTLGAKSTLTVTFDNTLNAGVAGRIFFNDTLPSGFTVDPDVPATNTCASNNTALQPTFSVDAGAGTISLDSNGAAFGGFETLSAGESCSFTVPLVGSSIGSFIYTSATASADFNNLGPASATFSVTGAPAGAPLFTKSFTGDPVDPGDAVSVLYTIQNNDRSFSATSLGFTDDIGAVLAGTTLSAVTSNTCGGSVSGVGTGTLTLSGGSVSPGGATCQVAASFAIPAGAAGGNYDSTTSTVTAQVDGTPVTGNAAMDTLIVRDAPAPTATVSFTDTNAGGDTTMTVEITNQSGSAAVTDLVYGTSFDTMPIRTLTSGPANGSCGAGSTFSFTPFNDGGFTVTPASVSMTGGALPAGGSCTLTWVLGVAADAPGDTYSDTSDPIEATVGGNAVIGGRATGSMTVGGGINLSFSKLFESATLPDGTVDLTFTLASAAESPTTATNVSFTDDLNAMLAGAVSTGVVSNACGGTVTGSSTVSVSGVSLAPGATCDITIGVSIPAAAADGTYTNTTSSLTADGGLSFPAATADLSVFSLQGQARFLPSDVIPGETTSYEITFTNSSSANDATGLLLTLDLNSVLTGAAATMPPTSNSCGGTASGTTFVIYSGGTVSAGASCTIALDVTVPGGADSRSYVFTTGLASAMINGSNVALSPVAAQLTVETAQLLLDKSFASAVTEGGTATMTFAITNQSGAAASAVAFTDDLGAFLSGTTLASVNSNTCGASVAGAGTNLISVSGGSIPANSSCSISLDLTIPTGSTGAFENVTSPVSGQINGLPVSGDAARATLTVNSGVAPSFTKSFTPNDIAPGGTATVSYSIDNPGGGAPLSGLRFQDTIGTDIPGASVALNALSGACGSGSTLTDGTSVSLASGTLGAGESCTITGTVTVPILAGGNYTSTTTALTSGGTTVAPGAAATLRISPPPPTFAQAVDPANISQGEVAQLRYTITNPGSGDPTNSLTFVQSLPAGVSVAASPAASSTCGGAVGAAPGAGSISFSGGSLSVGATCTIAVNITSTTVGAANFGEVTLSSDLGNTNSGTATLNVALGPAPVFTSSFAPASIPQGSVSTATFTIDNSAGLVPATALAFSNTLPAGVEIASPANASNLCTGGTLTAPAGGDTLSFSGGTVAAGAVCSISVDVTSVTVQSATNTSGALTSSQGSSGTTTASLDITLSPPPVFSMSFGPSSIVQGAVSTLTYTIDNTTGSIAAESLAFSNNLPANVIVAASPNASTTCSGGTLTAAAGTGVISYSGGEVAASGSCTVTVDVTSAVVQAATNTSGALSSAQGNSGTASAVLNVTLAPAPGFSAAFTPASIVQGDVSRLTLSIDNAGGLIDVTSLDVSSTLPSDVVVAASPDASTSCTGGALTAAAGTATFAYAGGSVAAGGTCDISVNVTTATVQTANFTSGALASSQGSSGTASASLSVTAATPPTFDISVAPTTIVQGAITTVSVSAENTALVSADLLSVDLFFPPGVSIAPNPNPTGVCDGGNAVPIAGGVRLTADTVDPGDTCSLTFDVRAVDAGAAVFTTGDLISSLGNSGGDTAILTVTAAGLPIFTSDFDPSTILQGEISTLSYSIDNGANLVAAENGGFATNLPAGLSIADTPNFQAICTGASTAGSASFAAGGTTLDLSGIEVAEGASCAYAIDVTSVTVGAPVVTSGDLVTDLGNSGTAAAQLTVNAAPVPLFTAAYDPASIVQGDISTLTFTIDNAAALVEATGLQFAQRFASQIVIADPANVTNTCGGTVSADAGTNGILLDAGTVAAGASCTLSVEVTSDTAGVFDDTSSVLSTSQGDTAQGASARLTVLGAPAPLFSAVYDPASIVQGEVTSLIFTIDNAAALVEARDLAFDQTLPAGVTIADPSNAASTCVSGSVTATVGEGAFTFASGTVDAGGSCTVRVDVTTATAGDASGTSGALTSSLGDSGTAAATLGVTGATAPGFAKAFTPDTVVQGAVSTLSFAIDNSGALVAADALGFVDTMPAEMLVADVPNITNSCDGGTVEAVAGENVISLADASVPAGTSCEITVDVRLLTAAASTNVTGDLTSSLGNSGVASAVLTATGATPPTLAKVFVPGSIQQGEVSTLTYTIANSAAQVDATELALTEAFPSGLTLAADPAATSSCGTPVFTATAGEASFAFAQGTVARGEICTVSVNVTAVDVGDYTVADGALTSDLGDSGAASATLAVTASDAPGFSGTFVPPTILQGQVSRLILTVDNTGNSVGAGSLGLNVTLPNGVFVDGSPNAFGATSRPDVNNTCGGAVTAEGGATTVTLAGGAVAAAATCQVAVNVTSDVVGATGSVTGTLTSDLGGSTLAASADSALTVETNPEGQITFVQNASEDGTFAFSSTEAALNFSITTVNGQGSAGPISVTQGTYIVSQSRPAGVGNTALTCSDSDSVGDPFTGTLTLNVGPNESITCTYSSLSTAQRTTEVINSFLNRRNNLILSNGPSRSRRLARLNRGFGGSETLAFSNGDLKSFVPVDFNLLSIGSGSYSLSTSLYQAERAAMMFALAHDGIPGNTAIYNPRRFDIWFEAHYNEFNASRGSSGHFGIAYLGADYLVNPNVLAGAMLQFDTMEDSSASEGYSISGRGWMVGPYVTARVGPNLIFDGRLAYGQSSNDIQPFNTYEDEFDTERFLIDASLSGTFDWDNWVVTPNLSISYIEDRQKSYTDSLNVAIPSQTVSLGQIKFGPTFSTRIEGRNHMVIEPSVTLNGIYNFGNRSGPVITNNTADESDGLRARIEAAVRMTNRSGTRLEFGANYDGIGLSDFESWGANFNLAIPLQ